MQVRQGGRFVGVRFRAHGSAALFFHEEKKIVLGALCNKITTLPKGNRYLKQLLRKF